jgi:hypothetical protein
MARVVGPTLKLDNGVYAVETQKDGPNHSCGFSNTLVGPLYGIYIIGHKKSKSALISSQLQCIGIKYIANEKCVGSLGRPTRHRIG